jgi:hypothetical protein
MHARVDRFEVIDLLRPVSKSLKSRRARGPERIVIDEIVVVEQPNFGHRRLGDEIKDTGVTYERDCVVGVPGMGDVLVPILATRKDGQKFAIALSGPLTPDFPISADMQRLGDSNRDLPLISVDELMVRMNLPAATLQVSQQAG